MLARFQTEKMLFWVCCVLVAVTQVKVVCGQQTPEVLPTPSPPLTFSRGQTNEGNEFFVGFIRNRYGRSSEQEVLPPVLWIMTREAKKFRVEVSSIRGRISRPLVKPGKITYVNIPLEFIVFDSTEDSKEDSQFKGIRIKAPGNKKVVVFGQHEEVASNDAYLALPIISRPAGSSYEYISASVFGDSGGLQESKDSVALIVGTENDTEIILEPSVIIYHPFAPFPISHSIEVPLELRSFIPGAPINFRTVTIQRFQTFYLQVRGGDISGTRIIANKPISVFAGHECANVPIHYDPCDIVIEQIAPVDTWGTEVVTVPLRTRSGGDMIKVFASQNSTTVNVTQTNTSSGRLTSGLSFTLNANQFQEFLTDDFTLIQSNNPVGVFQFSRSYTADGVITSDPFMLSVPSCEQYLGSYAVTPAPFDHSIEGTLPERVAYVNYTNIVVPAEYFNASLLTVNNSPINASEFKPIRRTDNSIWGYGAQLLLDQGAQVIKHEDTNAALSVTMYGFSNQMSWGCTGGTGLAPISPTPPAPLCSNELCRTRQSILCKVPDSACLKRPQMGYCSATYYSTEIRSVPATCALCSDPTDLDCLKKWSKCVKKQDKATHGRPRPQMKTPANFKIYSHPC